MTKDSNLPESLPDGWAACSLRQVTLPVLKIGPNDDPDREVHYIDISSIDNARHVITTTKRYQLGQAPSRARQVVRAGDTLFSTVRPYLRNIALVPRCYDEEIASTGFSVLRPATGVCPAFLFYNVISSDFVNKVSGMQYGVSYPAVKDEQVRDLEIRLPPTAEQYRIAAKIDELFSTLDHGLENLKKAGAQLDDRPLRQAILKKALSGRLVAQDPNDEPAAVLLDRIGTERKQIEKRNARRRAGKRPEPKKAV